MVIVAVTPCTEDFGHPIDRGLLFFRDRLRCMGEMGKWSLMAKRSPMHPTAGMVPQGRSRQGWAVVRWW